jgi:hypothetical protein
MPVRRRRGRREKRPKKSPARKNTAPKTDQKSTAVLAGPLADAVGNDGRASASKSQKHGLIAKVGWITRLQMPLLFGNELHASSNSMRLTCRPRIIASSDAPIADAHTKAHDRIAVKAG